MKFYRLLIILVGILFSFVFSEEGCVDPYAENYNPDADTNDGSCVYVDRHYLEFDGDGDYVYIDNLIGLDYDQDPVSFIFNMS